MSEKQKVLIDMDLLIVIAGLAEMIKEDIYSSDNNVKIAMLNSVIDGVNAKFKALKLKELYEGFQEAKKQGDKCKADLLYREYEKLKNN